MPREKYSRTATLGARDACALALSRHIKALDQQIQGTRVKFAEVFDQWPTTDDKYETPAACVLPPDRWRYDEALTTPTLIESTWEHDDESGWGLYKTAEIVVTLMLGVRASSTAMRSLLKLAVEDAFQRPESLNMQEQRYGILLALPEYWNLKASAWLIDGGDMDSEDTAMRNQFEASFAIKMQCLKVQLGWTPPMAMNITKTMKDFAGTIFEQETVTFPSP